VSTTLVVWARVRYKVGMLDWIPEADLDSDHREALTTALVMMSEEWAFDIAEVLSKRPAQVEPNFMALDLPERFLATATPVDLKDFWACLVVLSYKLAQPEPTMLSCTAEEICLHAAIARASADLSDQGKTADFGALAALLFEDVDATALFDPDSALAELVSEHLGGANLDPEEWFLPFQPPRPALPVTMNEGRPKKFRPRVL